MLPQSVNPLDADDPLPPLSRQLPFLTLKSSTDQMRRRLFRESVRCSTETNGRGVPADVSLFRGDEVGSRDLYGFEIYASSGGKGA